MRNLLGVAAAFAMLATAAAAAELPAFENAETCTLFGKVPSPACLARQEEAQERSRRLWLKADESTRIACRQTAQTSDRPYDALAQCLSLNIGQSRLFAGGAASWWSTAQQ